jgi:hypothetical protein
VEAGGDGACDACLIGEGVPGVLDGAGRRHADGYRRGWREQAKAVFMAPCSVTHHSDMHQRYVELITTVSKGNKVQIKLPADEREAPRGIYMLWLVYDPATLAHAATQMQAIRLQ